MSSLFSLYYLPPDLLGDAFKIQLKMGTGRNLLTRRFLTHFS